jgi:hypothetical protein
VCEDLEEMYLTLLHAFEIISETHALFLDIFEGITAQAVRTSPCPTMLTYQFETNFYLFEEFVNLFVNYVRVNLHVESIAERKAVAVMYAYCYQFASGNAEGNFIPYAQPMRPHQIKCVSPPYPPPSLPLSAAQACGVPPEVGEHAAVAAARVLRAGVPLLREAKRSEWID